MLISRLALCAILLSSAITFCMQNDIMQIAVMNRSDKHVRVKIEETVKSTFLGFPCSNKTGLEYTVEAQTDLEQKQQAAFKALYKFYINANQSIGMSLYDGPKDFVLDISAMLIPPLNQATIVTCGNSEISLYNQANYIILAIKYCVTRS
jgi:hypothetical protein